MVRGTFPSFQPGPIPFLRRQLFGSDTIPMWDGNQWQMVTVAEMSNLSGTATVDSVGNPLPGDFYSLPQALGYDGSNNLITVTVVSSVGTYIQTLTYTGSNLTLVSAWVKQ